MNREEKNHLTRQRILDSALKEFSEKGYGASSINAVCSAQGVSKGIIYHYFKTKDELYLVCVASCFDALSTYLRNNVRLENKDTKAQLEAYFSTRLSFFYVYPVYQRIFFDAVIMPPPHLRQAIRERKQEFDELNVSILTALLSPLKLRGGLCTKDVIEIFRQYQDSINAGYQLDSEKKLNLEDHEQSCQKALDVLLYGILDRNE